jgi:uncharacterized membrane protein YphA (DoxX/SURF4 family)/TusA-related sulfurtransferase
MSHLPIPLAVLYAGLAGTVLALIVATAQNKWSPRVFFLLALRLAIGWHFLFEGLYKVQSYYTGPSDTNKPFTSEPYFRAAPGPLGPKMRKEFSDPAKEIADKVRAPDAMSSAEFASKTAEFDTELKAIDLTEVAALNAAKTPAEKGAARAKALAARDETRAKRDAFQAAQCPAAVATLIDANDMLKLAEEAVVLEVSTTDPKAIKDAEDKANKAADEAEANALKHARVHAKKGDGKDDIPRWTAADLEAITKDKEAAKAKAKADAENARDESKAKGARAAAEAARRVVEAKAAYARWVYGADKRGAQVKFVSGDVLMSGPERIAHLKWVQQHAQEVADRQANGLGNGTGTDAKRVAEFRMAAIVAEADLARDADAFIAELKKELNGGKAVEVETRESRGQKLDRFTMWFLVGVGAFIMGGLFTRLACVMAAGFLVVTYLAHPAFPWFPLPPNTEGNPVFVNKNVIEGLALLALACYPTGRWLGLDALVLRPLCKYKPQA